MRGTTVWFKDEFGKTREFKVKFHSIEDFPAVLENSMELRDVTYAVVQELTDGGNFLGVGVAIRKPGDENNRFHGENIALRNVLFDCFGFDEGEVVNFLVSFGAARAEQNIAKQLALETSAPENK